MNNTILDLNDIHTYYGASYILQGLSLKVEKGSTVALLGRNGMGKTTTIRSIIGFTPPREGTIHFRGQHITGTAPNRIARMGIGLVPQGRRIFPSLSVRENLVLAQRGQKKSDAWHLDRIYDLFPILKKRANRKGTLLSGGEQQMLAIGRALMTNPDLILMDEPSEGLAPIMVKEVGRILTNIKQSGVSVFIVEQNLPLALQVADYVYIISAGAIVHKCTPHELEQDEAVKTKYLGVSSS